MSRSYLNATLYSYRSSLSVALLLIILYFVLYTWVTVPPLALFLGWQPDTKLIVLENIADEYRQYVQPNDTVLAVDDRLVQRGQPVFTTSVQPSYEFTLQRDEAIFTQVIPVNRSELYQMWTFSLSVLALAFWFIGFVTARFARPQQTSPLYVGFGFQLIASGIASPGPSQLGAPGAWVIGNVLIFFFPLIMLYLGFIPRHTPMSNTTLKLMRGSFYLLAILATVGAVEVIFLFPEVSLKDVIGIRSTTILTILTGGSVAAAIIVLFIRLIRSPKQSYERQQLSILFVFLFLAVAPLFFFVILPVGQFLFVPFPFVYSLFLLAPSGYFFVLHRHGYLELDSLFSRIVTVVALTMAVGMAYATGVYLLDIVFKIDFSGPGQGAFVLVLFGIAVTGQKRVQEWVDLLLYGRDPFDHDSIQLAKTRLSTYPEPATVTDVAKQVALYLQVENVAVLVKSSDEGCYRLLAGNVPAFTVCDSGLYQTVCLRTRNPQALIDLPHWVELSLPMKARGDMVGLLLLSRPINSYFNARQVAILQDIADILAFSLLVISLVDELQHMSVQSFYEKEIQRQQIASDIHNMPLQTLSTVITQMQKYASDDVLREVADTIRQATQDLRRIISGLRPPVLRESVPWIVHQVMREFCETHTDIQVNVHSEDGHYDEQVGEQTKQAFYYILTEILNNISKHAQATEVDVNLAYGETTLTLIVKDNGVGTDVGSRPLTDLLRRHHMGMVHMHRWASIGKGTLEIKANAPSGTIIHLVLPKKIQPDQ